MTNLTEIQRNFLLQLQKSMNEHAVMGVEITVFGKNRGNLGLVANIQYRQKPNRQIITVDTIFADDPAARNCESWVEEDLKKYCTGFDCLSLKALLNNYLLEKQLSLV